MHFIFRITDITQYYLFNSIYSITMKTITIYPLRDYVKISISHVTKKFDGENNYMLHDAKFYNLLTGKRIKLGSFNIAEHQFLQVKRDRCDNNHPNLFDSNQGPHTIYVQWNFIQAVMHNIIGYNSITSEEQTYYKERLHALVKTEEDEQE